MFYWLFLRVPYEFSLHLSAAHKFGVSCLHFVQFLQIVQSLYCPLDWVLIVLFMCWVLIVFGHLLDWPLIYHAIVLVHLRKRYASRSLLKNILLYFVLETVQLLVVYLLQINVPLLKSFLIIARLHVHLWRWMFWIMRLVVEHRQGPIV